MFLALPASSQHRDELSTLILVEAVRVDTCSQQRDAISGREMTLWVTPIGESS